METLRHLTWHWHESPSESFIGVPYSNNGWEGSPPQYRRENWHMETDCSAQNLKEMLISVRFSSKGCQWQGCCWTWPLPPRQAGLTTMIPHRPPTSLQLPLPLNLLIILISAHTAIVSMKISTGARGKLSGCDWGTFRVTNLPSPLPQPQFG